MSCTARRCLSPEHRRNHEIGAFESGVAARLLGTVPSVIFGGIMTLVVVALTMAWSPQLRKMREIDAISKAST